MSEIQNEALTVLPESDASINVTVVCAVKGCLKQVATSRKAIRLAEEDSFFKIKCFPRAHNVIDSIICGNIYNNCIIKKVVINGRCFNKISCPKCESKPKFRFCLKCDKKFKPGCKLTHVCHNCFSTNSKPGRGNDY